MQLSYEQQKALDALEAVSMDSHLVDAELEGFSNATMYSLVRKGLAVHEGDNLWRITLGGLNYVRHGIEPKERGKLKTLASHEIIDQILHYIQNNPRCTIKDLHENIDCHKDTIRYHLKNLRKKGLVDDGNTRPYKLTVTQPHETQVHLDPNEQRVVDYLQERQPASRRSIALNTGIPEGTITGVLNRLRSRKLIDALINDETGRKPTFLWSLIK